MTRAPFTRSWGDPPARTKSSPMADDCQIWQVGWDYAMRLSAEPNSVVLRSLEKPLAQRELREQRDRLQAELAHEIRAVRIHGPRTDVEARCDLLGGQAARHQLEHVELAVGQQIPGASE